MRIKKCIGHQISILEWLDILKYIKIENSHFKGNIISQFSYFYCIFEQIDAALKHKQLLSN